MTKIMYNNENKKNIINSLNTCIDLLNKSNNVFSNTYIPYDFYYRSLTANTQNDIKNTRDNLTLYKDNLNRCTENISKKELELFTKINKIDEIIIEKFDISN